MNISCLVVVVVPLYLACVCFLFLFSSQRPLVPALHISTPIVMSTSGPALHTRRSLHLHHSHPLTPPTFTVSSPMSIDSVRMCHVSHRNNNSHPGTPTRLSQSYGSQPLTAPPISHKSSPHSNTTHFAFDFTYSSPVPEETLAPSPPPGQNSRSTTSPVKVLGPSVNRRSSDSDVSTPPKGKTV